MCEESEEKDIKRIVVVFLDAWRHMYVFAADDEFRSLAEEMQYLYRENPVLSNTMPYLQSRLVYTTKVPNDRRNWATELGKALT